MAEILLGSHVGMSGKEMFLGSVKEAAEYGANALTKRDKGSESGGRACLCRQSRHQRNRDSCSLYH